MDNKLKLIFGIGVLILIVVGIIFLLPSKTEVVLPPEVTETATTTESLPSLTATESLIGTSVEGRPIRAYSIGSGPRHLLFVGGIHGGYEWNSVLLAYEMLDHLVASPNIITEDLTITIIPVLNPDGLYEVTGKEGRFLATDVPATESGTGRFNANEVDLNRNFDCKWQPKSTWRGNIVSAGTAAFSEPEAKALRDFVLSNQPDGVVFWHSQANAVYASECEAGILAGTMELMNTYASAAAYTPIDTFDAYPVTGDAEGWLASIDIPAITVELSTHTSIEWQKNLAGVTALLNSYGK